MIRYGALKIIPSQMKAPLPLGVLEQRIGDIFPNHLLWWTVGASPAFETATGLAEMLGGGCSCPGRCIFWSWPSSWPRPTCGGSRTCSCSTAGRSPRGYRRSSSANGSTGSRTSSFQQPEKDVLILEGQLEGRRLRAKLRKVALIRRRRDDQAKRRNCSNRAASTS